MLGPWSASWLCLVNIPSLLTILHHTCATHSEAFTRTNLSFHQNLESPRTDLNRKLPILRYFTTVIESRLVKLSSLTSSVGFQARLQEVKHCPYLPQLSGSMAGVELLPSQIRPGPTQLHRDKSHFMIKPVRLLFSSRELASQTSCDQQSANLADTLPVLPTL